MNQGLVITRSMAMWCTIRTFAKHAVELGNQPVADPIFFVKPERLPPPEGLYRSATHPGEVHHEVECVVQIGRSDGTRGHRRWFGLDRPSYAKRVASRATALGEGKCFRSSAVLGSFGMGGTWDDLVATRTWPSSVNCRSTARNVNQRRFTRCRSHRVSKSTPLTSTGPRSTEGDVLFTGTPQGVGRTCIPGDQVLARLTKPNGENAFQNDVWLCVRVAFI